MKTIDVNGVSFEVEEVKDNGDQVVLICRNPNLEFWGRIDIPITKEQYKMMVRYDEFDGKDPNLSVHTPTSNSEKLNRYKNFIF